MRRGPALLGALAILVAAIAVTVAVRRLGVVDVSGDGLSLRLTADGAVASVRDGDRTLPGGDDGGFALRRAGGMPNRLSNTGFETDDDDDGVPDGWRRLGDRGRAALSSDGPRSGSRSWSVTSDSATEPSIALVTDVDVEPGTEYVIQAWIRTEGVRPDAATTAITPARVQVVQEGVPGRKGSVAAFGYTGHSPWTRHDAGFRTGAKVRRVQVRLLIRGGTGTAWFDDLSLAPLLGEPAPVGGWVMVALASGPARFRGDAPGTGLAVSAALSRHPGGLAVRGTLAATDGADHAAVLSFTLPADLRGWRWEDDPRRSRTIGAGVYGNLSETTPQGGSEPHGGINQIQRTSVYPFGGVADRRTALGIGIPMSEPRAARILATEDGLSIELDLGVSPDAGTNQDGSASAFAFALYRADGAWGFRALAEAHYRAFPGEFEGGPPPGRQGAWFFAPPRSSLEGEAHRDFGLGLNTLALGKAPTQSHSEWGRAYLGWSNARGIVTAAYTHHWMHFQPAGRDPGEPPAGYEATVARLRAAASVEPRGLPESVRRRAEARAALAAGARDVNGRYLFETYRAFDGFYVNADAGPEWYETVERHQLQRALDVAGEAGGRLDAIHLDSTSGARRWGAVCDHHRPHWRAARLVPLTFSYANGEPCQLGALGMARQLQRVEAFARARGMLVTANHNAGPDRAVGWIGADVLDVFGLEQGLPEKAVEAQRVDALAMLKRTLARQRPVTTLDDRIAGDELSLEEIDARLRQSLFYGVFPGAWTRDENEGGPTPVTWSTPAKRAVFARYAPVLRALAAAGWEPVTRARASDPGVWVERFGPGTGSDAYFTLRNETDVPRTVTLRLEAPFVAAVAVEVLSGRELPVRNGSLDTTIAAHDTLVLRLPASPG